MIHLFLSLPSHNFPITVNS